MTASRRHLLGSPEGSQLNPCHGHFRPQLVDGDSGHDGTCGVQQPAGQIRLRPRTGAGAGRADAVGRPLQQQPQRVPVHPHQPDRQCPPARIVREHHQHTWRTALAGAGFGVDQADCGHRGPPGQERDQIGTVGGDIDAQPPARFMQAALHRARGIGELVRDAVDGQIRVVEQPDHLFLPGWQARQRQAQRLSTVKVLEGRFRPALDRPRMQRLRPVVQQGQRHLPAAVGAVDVDDDPGQPAREPIRLAQPVQCHERLQERFLDDVVGLVQITRQ
jgi:hypothetical protein